MPCASIVAATAPPLPVSVLTTNRFCAGSIEITAVLNKLKSLTESCCLSCTRA